MKTEWSTYSLLDTNVLVYALEPSDEFKHEIANELFESLFSGEEKLAVSTQILAETLNVFTLAKMAKSEASIEDIYVMISDIISVPEIPKLVVNAQTVLQAAKLHMQFSIDFYDALIAATMKENGITTIYTEDKDFDKIAGITAINPFERHKKIKV